MGSERFINAIDSAVSNVVNRGLAHLIQTGELSGKNEIWINGNKLQNFTSCSYFGLEHDPRLKNAAKAAIDKYGTQFSESRAYVSIELYQELEELMSEIFDAHAIVAPTTTLGHASAIPVLLRSDDAVICDQQLHNSVQSGISIFRSGCPTKFEILRHSRMDLLKQWIVELEKQYERIWYFADGIYSMFGDACPISEIITLLEEHPSFYAYIDDAHGMSIFGKRGSGYIIGSRGIHSRMIVASSMAKAFATGGGILVFPNQDLARKVRNCGAPFNSSGPLQPGTLGAAVASAKIHLSNEIYQLQDELSKRIQFSNLLIKGSSLPLISNSDSAIFFIGTSRADIALELMEKMMKKGFLINLGVFPAVSHKHSGVRFTITTLQSYEQIEKMITTLNDEFLSVLKANNYSIQQILEAFKEITYSFKS